MSFPVAGEWAATEAEAVLFQADAYRDEVALQCRAGGPVYLAFGETPAEAGKGLAIGTEAPFSPFIRLSGRLARMKIRCICGTGDTAAGGHQVS